MYPLSQYQWYLKTPRAALAARAIQQGKVIAYPTEGVWGLGCDPENLAAVARILFLKSRAIAKGLILVCDRSSRLNPFVANLPPLDPFDDAGVATTWLIEHGGKAPSWITGGGEKLAVRLSTHPLVAAVCARANTAIVSTSANPAGMSPALNMMQVRRYFGDQVDMIVPGSLGHQKGSSQILDWDTRDVIRQAEV